MAGLLLDDLDAETIARLRAEAAARKTDVGSVAGEILARAMGVSERDRWAEEIRALRRRAGPDPALDTVGLIRAERAARTARILGEDDAEAWAAAYRSAQ